MTEKFPCELCDKSFKTQQGVRGHQKVHKKVKKVVPEVAPTAAPEVAPPPEAPEVKVTEGPSSYPSLSSWKTGEVKKEAEAAKTADEVPKVTPVVGQSAPFLMGGIWTFLGDFIDNSILKDAPGGQKINMTSAKAATLDASLASMGLQTTPPEHAINVPYWSPILLSVVGVFVLPIVMHVGKSALKPKMPKDLPEGFTAGADRAPPPEPEPQPQPVPLTDQEKAQLSEKQRRAWETD